MTNGGGPGALAVDALIIAGGELAQLSETTLATLDSLLPSFWSKNNPVDLLGDADAKRFAQAIQVVGRDPLNDGVLVILTPQAMTQPVGSSIICERWANSGNCNQNLLRTREIYRRIPR